MGMLSVEQKYNIILMAERHPKWTQLDLAKWAYEAYQLPTRPSQGTISRLLARKTVFMNSKEHEKSANRLRKPNNLLVRRILQEWISQSIWNGIPITPPIIQDTAQSVWHRIPAEYREGNGSFSHKWITHFLSKIDVNHSTLEREPLKPSKVWTFEERGQLKELLGRLPPRDLFTLDETFLAYNLPLDYGQYETSKIRKMVEVVTVMLCANLEGSEKMNPLVIGRYENYNSFRSSFADDPPELISQANLGEKMARRYSLTYHSNRKSWLTSNLFHDWLAWWDKRLVVDNRKIWIILDDSCSHRVINLRLKNIQLIYTSANSRFLPFNWGTLDEFKTRYRIQQYTALLKVQKLMEEKSGAVKFLPYEQSAVNMSNAFKLIRGAWDGIPIDTIRANWKSSGILPKNMIQLNEAVSMAFKKNEYLEKKLNELSEKFRCSKKWDYDILLDLNIENKNTNFLSSEEMVESAIVDEWEPETVNTNNSGPQYANQDFSLDTFEETEDQRNRNAFESLLPGRSLTLDEIMKFPSVSEVIDKTREEFENVTPNTDGNHDLGPTSAVTNSHHSSQMYPSEATGPAYLEDVFSELPQELPPSVSASDPPTNNVDAQLSAHLSVSASQSPASINGPGILEVDSNSLGLANDFNVGALGAYFGGQNFANTDNGSPFDDQRLVIFTTLQSNIEIAKSMGNILKHAEFREVGLSDQTLNELRVSYGNCLKKIKKAKQALASSDKRRRQQSLGQRLMEHDRAIIHDGPTVDKTSRPIDLPSSLGIETAPFFTPFPPNPEIDITSIPDNPATNHPNVSP
ncbi:LAMI_0H11914g1_1 [Lachancea mirantina]|uniref:LAMI_0H11914g1_1 n=1 Tax=Lachancea mirantina TaxID=1230905 RepID=A0A1G4KHH3_9SACH|nr:LAMI_0H11914g1_1 [Lachancea mirantina]